jgi:Dyp-type peroxidase family
VWLAVALTYQGLRALGVPQPSLDSFPAAFRDGMAARAEQLGDIGDSAPERWQKPYGTGEIHLLVSIVAATPESWQQKTQAAMRKLGGLPGVVLLDRDDFSQLPGGRSSLGYKDGISYPHVAGSGMKPLPGEDTIAAGEFILGYAGESGFPLPMPTPDVLGRNGTFVGFRKLHTHVAAFRRFLRKNSSSPDDEELLAAKLVGRWRSGAPLVLAPEHDDPDLGEDPYRNNNFTYADDPRGLRCPLGSHIRRNSPRDSDVATLTDVNLHRIIRHGTSYGPPLPEGVLDDDNADRGIYFIFISAKAPSTLEFLKSQWINDGNFFALSGEKDPLVGANDGTGTFTIPQRPVRRRIHGLESFVMTRGGEYGFVPSLSALHWLSELPP